MHTFQKIFILILLLPFSSIVAQTTITMDSLNGQVVNGTQITIDTNNLQIPHFYVKNNSGSTQNWMITRKIISQPTNWYNYLCWGELCYSASSSIIWSSDAKVINNSGTEELSLYVGAPSVGSAHYRYYVSTNGVNFVDSVDIIVTITSTVGVNEKKKNNPLLFPNPAQNKISLTGIKAQDYNLMIYNISGQQVLYKETFSNNNIDISTLKNGHYIFILRDKATEKVIRKKVIVEK